VRKVISKKE